MKIIFDLGRRLIHDTGFLHHQILTEQDHLNRTGRLRSVAGVYRTPWHAPR